MNRIGEYFSGNLLDNLNSNKFSVEIRDEFYIIIHEVTVLYRLKQHEFNIDKIVYFCDKNLYHSSWCKDEKRRYPREKLLELLLPYTREKSINQLLDV